MTTCALSRTARRLALVLVPCVLAPILAGCDNREESPGSGRVAIIDLDRVLDGLGRKSELAGVITERQSALRKQLRELSGKLNQQYEAKVKEFGENPSDAEKRQLQEFYRKALEQYSREEATLNAAFEAFKQDQLKRFREEVRPVARDAARSKGLDVVLTKLDPVFIYPPEVDITEDVLARMLGSGGGKSASSKAE